MHGRNGKFHKFSVRIVTSGSISWRGSGVDGGDGVFNCVGYSSAVTPVARDTLLGVWRISSLSI